MVISKTETPQILDEATEKKIRDREKMLERVRVLGGVPKSKKTIEEVLHEEAFKRGKQVI